MEIIQLNKDHLEQLVSLFDAYRQFYRKVSDPSGAYRFLTERLDKNEAVIFGAFEEKTMTGFTLLYPLFSSTRMKPIYLLNDLYVDPYFRNNAIGKALLSFAQQCARKTDRAGILLETEKSNVIGNYLYPAAGFEAVSDSNFYFWDNI